MLALPMAGNEKLRIRDIASNGTMFIQNFIKICPVVLKLKYADREKDTASVIRVHFCAQSARKA
jgi:hypothetical protein